MGDAMTAMQKALALVILACAGMTAPAYADVGVTLRFGQNEDGELAWDEKRPGRGLYGYDRYDVGGDYDQFLAATPQRYRDMQFERYITDQVGDDRREPDDWRLIDVDALRQDAGVGAGAGED